MNLSHETQKGLTAELFKRSTYMYDENLCLWHHEIVSYDHNVERNVLLDVAVAAC